MDPVTWIDLVNAAGTFVIAAVSLVIVVAGWIWYNSRTFATFREVSQMRSDLKEAIDRLQERDRERDERDRERDARMAQHVQEAIRERDARMAQHVQEAIRERDARMAQHVQEAIRERDAEMAQHVQEAIRERDAEIAQYVQEAVGKAFKDARTDSFSKGGSPADD